MNKEEDISSLCWLIINLECSHELPDFFSSRGLNIDSLCISETTDPLVSRITLVAVGDMAILEQIKKQLNKLINVIKVYGFYR